MTTKRNYGIDLLRIVAMFMIVVLHVLGKGGILNACSAHSSKYNIAWFLDIASYCGVNCYALISGYVGFGNSFKISRLICLWIEVVFYSLGISIIFKCFYPHSVSAMQILTSFLPVTQKKYWYFTAYFAIYFFIPFFNYLIENLSFKQATSLVICCIMVFSVLPVVSLGSVFGDFFVTGYGYSPLWLAVLYLIGAFLKKYYKKDNVKNYAFIVIYALCIIITYCTKLLMGYIGVTHERALSFSDIFVAYTSPTVLGAGIVLLLLFSHLRIKGLAIRVITFFSSTSFAVYLIQLHPNIWNALDCRFVGFINYNALVFMLAILCSSFMIWLSFSLIDRIRIAMFRALQIASISNRIEKRIMSVYDMFIKEIQKRLLDL